MDVGVVETGHDEGFVQVYDFGSGSSKFENLSIVSRRDDYSISKRHWETRFGESDSIHSPVRMLPLTKRASALLCTFCARDGMQPIASNTHFSKRKALR